MRRLIVLGMVLALVGALPAHGQEELTTVVIDPGHGGKDPGTMGRHSKEKDVVLAVSLRLGEKIRAAFPDVRVIFTRETDEFIELNQRSALANEAGAGLFISIHCNSATAAAKGAETFVMGLKTSKSNLEVAQRENAVITYEDDYSRKYEGYDPHSPESFIIFSLMQNVFLDHSLEFAGSVQEELTGTLKRVDRGVKQAGFLVLYKCTMPSVLIELGFLTNPSEERYLTSAQGQEELAESILQAFRTYKAMRDDRASSPPPQVAVKPKPASGGAYLIQIASIRHRLPPNHPYRSRFPGLIELKDGDRYRYYSGRYASSDQAQTALAQVREHIPDAYIVNSEHLPALRD